MIRRVALLRAVNVGGTGKAKMSDIRALMTRLGLRDVRSLLHAGNVVFVGGGNSEAALEARLEREMLAGLGLSTHVFVRGAGELGDVIVENPFPAEAELEPARLAVMFLKSAPAGEAFEALQRAVKGREVVRGVGRHLYAVYPDGMGTSKLTAAAIEAKLGVRGTARNWNTVRKLHELLAAAGT